MFEFIEIDYFEDDVEVLEIANVGFPRTIRERSEYFHTFDELSFYKRFRLKKDTTLGLLALIESDLEFPSNK